MLIILLSAGLILGPGLVIARAGGLRGWTGLGAAPLLSYGVAATAGPLSSALRIGWGPLTFLTATVVLAGTAGAARRWSRRGPPRAPGRRTTPSGDRYGDRVIAAGVLGGAVLGGLVILRGIGGFDAVHQGWDAGFHANAVRLIIDTGDAAPGALAAINNYEDPAFFYPNGQHVLTAVVGQLTGASVPSLLNAQMVLLPGIAGLGLAVLVRACGGRVALAATLPLLLVSFSGFSYDLLTRGPLLPYATGLAMIPAFLALLRHALATRTAPVVLLTSLSAAALLAVHPSTALTAAIFGVALLVQRWPSAPAERRRAEAGTLLVVAAVAAVAALPYLIGTVGVGESGASVQWPARQTWGGALGGLLLLDPGGDRPQYWLVALIVVGVLNVRAIRPLWWWLGGAGVFAVLYVTVSATDAAVAEALTQPWWNDRWRFLALVTLAQALLAAHGAVVAGDWVAGVVRRALDRRAPTSRAGMGAALAAVLVIFGVLSDSLYAPANEDLVSASYRTGPTSTPGMRTAMRALAELAGRNGRVMNDPGDGSLWMYALEDVRPVFGHVIDPDTFGSIGIDQQHLLFGFHCLDSSRTVRELVRKYDIDYVFTGSTFLRDSFSRVPGLRDLGQVDSLDLVYDRGGASIYRVRPGPLAAESAAGLNCDGPDPAFQRRMAAI